MVKEKNDSKDQKRGDFYQALVSIKYALEYSEKLFQTLVIEHKGDVTFDSDLQIEVKHHAPKGSLGDAHIDFWKTLYNWCIQTNEYQSLILHTTSYFPTRGPSSLKTWAKQTVDQRYQTIIYIAKNNKAQGVSEYMNYVSEMNVSALKGILSKIELKTDQLIDEDLIEFLTKNTTIQLLASKPIDRVRLVKERLAGFIVAQVVGSTRWEITQKQFLNALRTIGRDFLNDNYSSTFDKYLNKKPEAEYSDYKEKRFIEELNEISCDDSEVLDAINDYWKTSTVLAEENELNPIFNDAVYQPYKNNIIYPKLINKKRLISTTHSECKKTRALDLYRSAKEISFGTFKMIPDYVYFQHGTMHIIVNDDDLKFSWLYE